MANKKIKPKSSRKIVSKSRQKNEKVLPIPAATSVSGSLSYEAFFSLIAGIVLTGLVFLQVDAFRWLGVPINLPLNHFSVFLMLGLALMAYGLHGFPPEDPNVNLPRRFAYPILAIVLVVGAYLRFYRADQSIGNCWDDPAVCIADPRNIVDLHMFRILFPVGAREPLYPYVAAFVWWLVPTWKAVFVQRVAANIFNFAMFLIFYRLGREVSGKRLVGLLLVAFAVASKPLLFQNVCGMGGLTLSFGVGLFLLAQVRLLKKPDLMHFIQWGLAMALGLYTYNAIRTWVPFLAIVTLAWIFWQSREKNTEWPVRIVVSLFSVGFLSFFLDKMLCVAHGNVISKIWGGTFGIWVFAQIVFLTALIYCYQVSGEKGKRLCGWALGLSLTGILSYPLTTLPDAVNRIASISLIPQNIGEIFTFKFLNLMINQSESAVKALFVWGEDRVDMNFLGDPFFDFHAVIFVVLGLVWVVVRPSWWKTFFFCCAWVGIIPRILTIDPTSAKLLGAAPVLLLLAAIAFGRWIEGAWGISWKKRWMAILLIIGLVVFWMWEIKGTFQRVYEMWWYDTSGDVCLGRLESKDFPDKRVYLVPSPSSAFFSPMTQGVINDCQPIYLFNGTNEINVFSQKELKDVVVYISPNSNATIDLLKKQYPLSQWTPIWQYYQKPEEKVPFGYRVFIPKTEILDKPGKLFFFHIVSNKTWIRRIYAGGFGMARGMIDFEDASLTLNPVSVLAGGQCVSADGQWNAPVDGNYIFSVNSPNFVQIWVDGKIQLDIKPGVNKMEKASHSIELKKGPHQIRYLSYLRTQLLFADVAVKNSDLNMQEVLGSN